jgi:phage baseplate assembly protein W
MPNDLYTTRSKFNTSDYPDESNTLARKKGYSDIDFSLLYHPYDKDIRPLRDDRAIRNSLKNMLNTDKFERPFQPRLGTNLRGLLFEPMDTLTELSIEDSIRSSLSKETRVSILKVEADGDEDSNLYNITIKFKIKENNRIETLPVVLRRLR